MKLKYTTKQRGSNGTRGLQAKPRSRRPPAIEGWPASTAVLISKSAVPKVRQAAAGPKANAVRVFLIDDDRRLRAGLTAMLSARGLRVVATAESGAQALRQVARIEPDLVLLGSALGGRDSVRLVGAVRKLAPKTKVIVMHLLASHVDVVDFVLAGVSGFIMKNASAAEFVATIRTVADGGSVLLPRMTSSLFSHVADEEMTQKKRSAKAATRMTGRERDVTGLIAKGLGNREIGRRLSIAEHTVKSHVHNILEKLALHTRLEVAAYAHANGKRRTTQ